MILKGGTSFSATLFNMNEVKYYSLKCVLFLCKMFTFYVKYVKMKTVEYVLSDGYTRY